VSATGTTRRRALTGRLDVRLIALLLILPLTFLASHSCGQGNPAVTQSEAITIAQHQIDYRPDGTNVRFVRRGIPSRAYWAVSLWRRGPDGGRRDVTVVVLDAVSGDVTQITRNTSP
jgi:hypothetical protein